MSLPKTKVKVVPGKRGKFLLRWRDETGPRERSTDLPAVRSKRRAAEKLAIELEAEMERKKHLESDSGWAAFQNRYYAESLNSLSKDYRATFQNAVNSLERSFKPSSVDELTSSHLSKWVAHMRGLGRSESTIRTYLRHLMAGLNWAVEPGKIIEKAPIFKIPKNAKGQRPGMRSRPPNQEEFERLLLAVPHVRPNDSERWIRYLRGLWLSGLRSREAHILSWDWDADFAVDISGDVPQYRIFAEGQKRRVDELLPIVPDFVEFLEQTTEKRRKGLVFKMPWAQEWVGKVVGRIGERAAVKVNRDGKTLTAHDLRRAFGTRWAKKLDPAELKMLMRHRSIETTMEYYVHLDAKNLFEKLQKGGQIGGHVDSEVKNQVVKDLVNGDD